MNQVCALAIVCPDHNFTQYFAGADHAELNDTPETVEFVGNSLAANRLAHKIFELKKRFLVSTANQKPATWAEQM